MLKIGIVGVGTVGRSVIDILETNKEIITARAGEELVVVKGVVRNIAKRRDVNIPLSDNYRDVTRDPDIDIVVELMGGIEDAREVVEDALRHGKRVATANKAMLAYYRYELEALSGDIPLAFEASVAGGIPIIKAIREGLSANHIESIRGIINGTCNYILTKMVTKGDTLETVLKEAQELGYAEADPTFDVGGYDAAHKILILGSIAYGIDAKPEEILIEGITGITLEDVEFAKNNSYTIKHLGIARRIGLEVSLRVHPVMIPKDQMIAKVDGVMNGISVVGDRVGETMFYGPGAGGDATASAVIADLVQIARDDRSPMLGFKTPLEQGGLSLAAKEDIITKYYIRLQVEDKLGVLEKVASVFAQSNISIQTVQQKSKGHNEAFLLITTHEAREPNIVTALSAIESLPFVSDRPTMIRIED